METNISKLAKEIRQLRKQLEVVKQENRFLENNLRLFKSNEEIEFCEFETIVDKFPDPVFILHDYNESHIVYANEAFETLSGYSFRKEKYFDASALVHPDFVHVVSDHRSQRKSGNKKLLAYEAIAVTSDNRHVWLSLNSIVVKFKGVERSLIHAKDITHEKEINEQILKSKNNFKSLFYYGNNINLIIDDNHALIVDANHMAVEFFKCTKDQLVGKSLYTFLSEDQPLISSVKDENTRLINFVVGNGEVRETEVIIGEIKLERQFVYLYSIRDVTQANQHQRNHLESEARYKAIVDNSYDGIYIYKKDKVVYANKKVFEISGYVEKTFFQANFWNVIHPDDRPRLQGYALRRAKGLPTENSYYAKVICADGTVKECEFSTTAIQLLGEYAVLGVVRDVSEKKRAEDELRKSEEKFRFIAENSIDIIWQVDRRLRVTYVSPSLTKVLGYLPEEWLGLPVSKYMEFKDFVSLARLALTTMNYPSQNPLVKLEAKFKHKRFDVKIPIEIEGKVFYSKEKQVLGLHGTARDVSERYSMVKALKENVALYKAIFGNTGTATCITASNGDIILVNKEFEFLSGGVFDQESYLSIYNFLPDLLHENASSKPKIPICKHQEYDFINTEGMHKPVVCSVQTIEGSRNYVISILDISKRKGVEFELKKLNEDLEERVKTRTQELMVANNAKSEFLANMNHEIRTPINAILGFAELLERNVVEPKARNYLDSILVSGRNLLSIINNTLDLSKVEAGKLDLDLGPVNIERLVEELEQMFKLKAANKGIRLNSLIQNHRPDSYYVMDGNRLKQVLINLVNNAIKFTKEGEVEIGLNIKSKNSDENKKASVSFYIKDTGIGIPEVSITKIFEPFSQVNNFFEDGSSTGTGLGLSICLKLVSLMNGRLTVKSEVGKGSVFTMEFKDVDVFENKDGEVFEIEEGVESRAFLPATVLVVDDIHLNRMYLKSILSEMGLSSVICGNGAEALDILNKEKIDLIITDLKMPIKDGFELKAEIENIESVKDTPIIAATAMTNLDNIDKIKAYNFSSFVLKPYTIDDVRRELIKFLPQEITMEDRQNEIKPAGIIVNMKVSESLYQRLNKSVYPKWKQLNKILSHKEVIEFGEEMILIGNEFNFSSMIQYGNLLIESMDLYDINQIVIMLKEFGDMMHMNKQSFKN